MHNVILLKMEECEFRATTCNVNAGVQVSDTHTDVTSNVFYILRLFIQVI